MFWNALARKNKVGSTAEEDIDVVVAIHNNMNENTWKQVLAWEALHPVK
jgi:cytochrome c heme-lyase